MPDPAVAEPVLDVRQMPKPDKHPAIFAAFDALSRGEAFILVNDHDPKHLREEFERDRAGSFSWDYLSRERRDWQIRIGKVTSTAPPTVTADTAALASRSSDPDASGEDGIVHAQGRQLLPVADQAESNKAVGAAEVPAESD